MNRRITIGGYRYGIQYSGKNTGNPAVFIIMGGCNLNCNNERGGWNCNTFDLWTNSYSTSADMLLLKIMKKLPKNVKNISMVFTGGEPMLLQKELLDIVRRIDSKFFIEVETNGTVMPRIMEFVNKVDLWTVSPKLPSSGNPYANFYNEKALDFLMKKKNSYFKFDMAREVDIDDVYNYYGRYIERMPRSRIYLQPVADTPQQLKELTPAIMDLCKMYGFNFSSQTTNSARYETDARMEIYAKRKRKRELLSLQQIQD